MPRTSITPVAAQGPYPTAGVVLALTAADVANQNQVTMSGKDLLLVFNSDASPHNVTITSVADPFSRIGDITSEAVAATTYKIYGPFTKFGWAQAGGVLFFSSDNALVKFAVIQIPN